MRISGSRPAVSLSLIGLVLTASLSLGSTASSSSGQARNCQLAVKAVQDAVNDQASATAEMRRAICGLNQLKPEERSGRPQAILDSRIRGYQDAQKKTAAAYANAKECDTSTVKRPQITDYDPAAADETIACYLRRRLIMLNQTGVKRPNDDSIANCDKSLETLNCGNIRVVDESAKSTDDDSPVTVPEDIKPECRDTYLKFKVAEKDYERAKEKFRAIATSGYGAAGAKGAALLNAANKDRENAATALQEARARLSDCQNQKGATYAGKWRTTWGDVTIALNADGKTVQGSYSYKTRGGPVATGSFTGTVNGHTLIGKWSESLGNISANGTMTLTLTDDGTKFTGTWKKLAGTTEVDSGTWTGTRVN